MTPVHIAETIEAARANALAGREQAATSEAYSALWLLQRRKSQRNAVPCWWRSAVRSASTPALLRLVHYRD